ncbi:MAG: hypothetical protein J7578_15935, partial [Chitinophagaceae bacterium]|nr:hypothetical protein [Chitinophagaceae bacterium]
IRGHQNLNVTSPNKMGAAQNVKSSFSETLNQTIWFPLDKPEILRANYLLGNKFLESINREVGFNKINDRIYLAKQKIPGFTVLNDFLNRYGFADREDTGGPGMDSEQLLRYISDRLSDPNPELQEWSIALVGNLNPIQNVDPAIYGGLQVNMIQRSRKHTLKGYNIGVLTEPDHLFVDMKDGASKSLQNPLLLLYLIWKGSEAVDKDQSNPRLNQRIDLYRNVDTEKVDLLGLAIQFPKSSNLPNNYIGQ